ncbi:MAG: isoprenylcysteine carboxylmethyltransferase family protein [Candidatus Lokiarchaeota archaeon]|nr:isoprenylcysteine carboxylmethyltransferase family protein [Candidatus Lokiarchaeota archaeon]
MRISGLQRFINYLPDYSEKQSKLLLLRLPGFAILFFLLQIGFFYSIRFLTLQYPIKLFKVILFIVPILNNIIFIFFGTLIAQLGFHKKKDYLEKYGNRAYQRIVKTILFGISMVFAGILFGYVPLFYPSGQIGYYLSQPFYSWFTNWDWVWIRYTLGGICFLIALRTAYRAVEEFGIDTAAMVYVYFPEDAKIVDHDIYSIVRHPMYLAVVLVAIGGFLTHFSGYSILLSIITYLNFCRHILVEERELKIRFGKSYEEYIKRTPGMLISPKNWPKFFKFLIN